MPMGALPGLTAVLTSTTLSSTSATTGWGRLSIPLFGGRGVRWWSML